MKSVISFVLASLLLLTSSYSFSSVYVYHVKNGTATLSTSYLSYSDACTNLDTVTTGTTYYSGSTFVPPSSCDTTVHGKYTNPATFSIVRAIESSCPSPYIDDGNMNCIEPAECPKGQFNYGNGCENICVAGNKITVNKVCPSISHIESAGDGGSCGYKFVSFPNEEIHTTTDPDITLCTLEFESTGEYIPDTEPENVILPDVVDTTTDSRSSSSETIIDTSQPVTNPDGSISQTETKTTTNVTGNGSNVIVGDNTITIKDSDGTTTVYSENKTTVTHPDGSITETINQDTNTTTSPVNNTVITKNPPSVTNITNEGSTTYYNQTVVNHYDSNGNLTSSTTTQNGSGTSGDGGDSEKEGNCGAPGQPVCQVELSDNSDEYSDQYTRISQQESELADIRQKVVDELADTSEDYGLSGIIDFSVESLVSNFLPLPDSYTCNGITTTFLDGKIFEFEPCEDLQPLREVLAWVFFIYTLFAVHNVLLGRRLF